MSNFPFETFPLTKRIGIVNPVANLDARYGPWPTFNDALTGFSPLLRQPGLTVAVSAVGTVTEYWYKNGILNTDLILKQTGGGTGTDTTLTTFVTSNSGNWAQEIITLPSNLPANTVNTFSPSQYGIAYQTVNADQIYTFTSNFTPGRTLTLFLSGNHESIKRHRITLSGPAKINLNGAGQSNMFYTFQNHITKVTLTRQQSPISSSFFGTAEIIRTDLNESQGGLGFIEIEDSLGDNNFNNVSLLLHMNGTNGSQIFTDSSVNNLTVTPNGNVQINSSIFKFANGSAIFDGNGDYLVISSNSVFGFGTGNFTMEAWVYPTVMSLSDLTTVIDIRTSGGSTGISLFIESATRKVFFYDGSLNSVLLTNNTIPLNTWTHIAVQRTGSAWEVFINGIKDSATYTSSGNLGTTVPCYIGTAVDSPGNSRNFTGYIDEIRITKGIARYSSNFSIPVSPYPETSLVIDSGFLLQENGDRLVIRNYI